MTTEDRKQIYLERTNNFEELLKKQKRKLSVISLLRLAVIILAIYFIVLVVKTENNLLWLVSGLMFVLFFTLVSYHKNANDHKKLLQSLLDINEKELNCLNREFGENEDGNEFFTADHPWSYDLDIFGEGSLYQYLNRTATHRGPGKLAARMTNPVLDVAEIQNRQKIIRELSDKLDHRQLYTAKASLMDISTSDYEEVVRWSERDIFIEKYKWTKFAAWIMTIVSTAVIVWGIINPEIFSMLILVIIINASLLTPFFTRTGQYQAGISKKHSFLRTYSELMDLLSNEDFSHPDLQSVKNGCKDGSRAIKKLSGILDLFDQRLNLLMGIILNTLFLWDFHMLHQLADWNRKHKKDFEYWLDTAGSMDALFSLSGFAYNHPEYTFPEVDPDTVGLKALDLGHPMIKPGKRVDNTIDTESEKVVLITGANMAGKSTFLRAVGVNMILTYAGCPVCAQRFQTSNYNLHSSMRTADSLKDDESYFYAEIKRLKVIVDKMETGEKMLILLDEVLKGTNTTDKQRGSKGLIEKSLPHNVLCFIATHDLALGELEEKHNGKVKNYCFESYIEGLELSFDYKIMPGLAKNMNASFLMKKMGIVDG